MHAETSYPGKYLLSKMDYIVEEANKINLLSFSIILTVSSTDKLVVSKIFCLL